MGVLELYPTDPPHTDEHALTLTCPGCATVTTFQMPQCQGCAEKDVEIARLRGERGEFKDYYGTIVRSAKAAGLELDEKAPDYTVCESFRELVEARAKLAERDSKCALSSCDWHGIGQPYGVGEEGCFSFCPEHARRFREAWVRWSQYAKAEAQCGAIRAAFKKWHPTRYCNTPGATVCVDIGEYELQHPCGTCTECRVYMALESDIGKSAQAVIEAAERLEAASTAYADWCDHHRDPGWRPQSDDYLGEHIAAQKALCEAVRKMKEKTNA